MQIGPVDTIDAVTAVNPPPPHSVDEVLQRSLREDLGEGGDLTTYSLVDEDATVSGRIVARGSGTIAGLTAALAVFDLLEGTVETDALVADGTSVEPMTVLATVSGSARAILVGERTCLNLVGHLSGIASACRDVVEAVAGTRARVADTRKTTPGLRALEKYAVRCGGGVNHRFGLHDAVMIKDNHLTTSTSIGDAVSRAREAVGHTVAIELEVDRLDQIPEALDAGVDVLLLDNMTADQLEQAVRIVDGRVTTEASGGITPETAAEIAATGVDILSIGWITHSAPRLDVALDLD